MESSLFTAREKAAILWAEHVTLNTARQRDDVYEIVHKEYDDAEVVELTMAICYFNLNNRFVDSLKFRSSRCQKSTRSKHRRAPIRKRSANICRQFWIAGRKASPKPIWTNSDEFGAGEGNRTLVTCLGSKSSTIELHPPDEDAQYPICTGPRQGKPHWNLLHAISRIYHLA